MDWDNNRLARLFTCFMGLVILSLLAGCSAFMHGYTQDEYERRWWPIKEQELGISPSGMARLDLEMDFDAAIRSLVTANGYPDYIYVGPSETTELAYVADNLLFKLKRRGWDTDSEILRKTTISEAIVDGEGFSPMQEMARSGDKPPASTYTAPHAGVVNNYTAQRGPVGPNAPTAGNTMSQGNYYALVIGNRDYEQITDLQTPIADARAVAELLERQYGFSVKVAENYRRNEIIMALSSYRKSLREGDSLLIYYAGHGNIDLDTEVGYWMPVDAEKDNPANWISNNDIATALKAIRARHVLVVADSCYSGTLTRSVREYSDRRGSHEWVQRMSGKRSRTALTSGSNEPVVDGGGGGHSVFAAAFLDALRENRLPVDMDTLFQTIRNKVVVNANQTPVYADIRLADHGGGDFIFLPR